MNPTPAAADRAPIPLRKGIVKQVIGETRKIMLEPESAIVLVTCMPTHNFLGPTFVGNSFWFLELKLWIRSVGRMLNDLLLF